MKFVRSFTDWERL